MFDREIIQKKNLWEQRRGNIARLNGIEKGSLKPSERNMYT